MIIKADTIEEYIDALPEERQGPFSKLRQTILENLPEGYEEQLTGMINYVVPFSLYPAGYHCPPRQPLPFISIASQKNFLAFYHLGIYAHPELLTWFQEEYPNHCKHKLDMGKSCVRLKKMDQIPYELIGKLVSKMPVKEWIEIYENAFKKE